MEVAFVDACKEGEVKKAVTSATRLVWLEVMGMMVMVMVMVMAMAMAMAMDHERK